MRSIRPRTMCFSAMLGALLWAGASRAALPTRALGLEDALRQTAAVIEGNVVSVRYDYDEEQGPRTVATLERLVVRLGKLGERAPSSIELRSFGGFLPDGREVIATHVPHLAEGARVVVFLRNTEWTLSPVMNDLALRLVTFGSASALVDQYGRLVVGLDARGLKPGLPFFAETSNGLQPTRPERIASWITERDVEAALDPDELTHALVDFARARDVWPNATFSPRPRAPSVSWRRIDTPAPSTTTNTYEKNTYETNTDDAALLACFGPPSESADADAPPIELSMCLAEGGAP